MNDSIRHPGSHGKLTQGGGGSGLVAEGVSKVIEGTTLLAPVDLAVRPGECAVLRGANGAGKTTLLRILAGRLVPTTGTVQLGGRRVDERDAVTRQAIAALLGPAATYRDLTLADHLALIDATWGGDPDDCAERVHAQLETWRIDLLNRRFPHELSSGQTQVFRLACTFFRPCSVLLLDEPEQRLDADRRRLVAQQVQLRRDAGLAVVMASHDAGLTAAVATRVLELTGVDPT